MPAASSSPDPGARKIGEREFVVMMAAIMALQAACIDGMLPALGQIASELGSTDPNHRQLVIGVYLLGAGIGCLFPGALADRFGRRPVLFAALGAYIVFTVACALVTDFTAMIVLRFLQALTSAGLSILPSAIVRDRFSGDRMARAISTIIVVFMVVPMLAPSFGQAVLLVASWRWIFGALAVLAALTGLWVWLRLPETLNPDYRQSLQPRAIVANMAQVAGNRDAFGYVAGGALMTGAMFAYLNSSQQLIAEHFGAAAEFPLIFALIAATMALSNLTNSRIVEHFGARRVSHAGLLAFIAVSCVQVYAAHLPDQSLWLFVPLMAVNVCLVGFTGANFSSIALQPFARTAGAAASFQSFARMASGAALGTLVGQAYDNSARPLAWTLLAGGIAALLAILYTENGHLFRRLIPPGQARPVPGPH